MFGVLIEVSADDAPAGLGQQSGLRVLARPGSRGGVGLGSVYLVGLERNEALQLHVCNPFEVPVALVSLQSLAPSHLEEKYVIPNGPELASRQRGGAGRFFESAGFFELVRIVERSPQRLDPGK